jgi:ABC-2 type transport system permease protein/oleandomycin transport system permease protein
MSIQPLMFLVLFVFVFGGAIAGSSQEYLQFALPGILVQSVAFLPFTTALALNVDFQRGVIDRFRSLPIARSAVIGGRIMADGARIVWSVLIIVGFSMILVPLRRVGGRGRGCRAAWSSRSGSPCAGRWRSSASRPARPSR